MNGIKNGFTAVNSTSGKATKKVGSSGGKGAEGKACHFYLVCLSFTLELCSIVDGVMGNCMHYM